MFDIIVDIYIKETNILYRFVFQFNKSELFRLFHRTRRAERRGRSVAFSAAGATCRRPGHENDFPALDFLSGDVAPGKRPAVSGGNGYSPLGRRTAAPSLSDIPRRLVGLGEPRLLVPVPARCDQRFAGDGGERSQNRIFTSPSFSDHGSALAGERVVVASRDRRHRTRRAERRGRSVAFSAAGATCRRPGRENRFPLARLLAGASRRANAPRSAPENGPSERFGYQGTKYAPCRYTLESGKARKSKAVQGKARQGECKARHGKCKARQCKGTQC